ncbi:SHOCT domain-containing protein [Streptomyces sp. MOE7]|uniref:SHOCT domain-containing protein n=1 Tax=Streptomyces sp. MOE7 TaxID=1961713 RepID=UPI001F1A5493|nr:SHOCT domain-containing protein [Streptomyces sp. MOE7]
MDAQDLQAEARARKGLGRRGTHDVLVRRPLERLGLVRDVGRHGPFLGTDHHGGHHGVPCPLPSAPRGGSSPSRRPAPPADGGPEQILAERYARGEIDDEEYRRRLATLRGTRPGSAPSPPTP